MTALTALPFPWLSADELALDEKIRVKANKIVSRIAHEVMKTRVPDVSADVEHHFDRVINSANCSLEKILERFPFAIAKVDSVLDNVNRSINQVKIGDQKLDANGFLSSVLFFALGLCEQMTVTFRQTRDVVEYSKIDRLSLAQTIDLLRALENFYMELYKKLDEVSERIAIRDAMTEQPLETTGIEELDALNDL